MSKFSLYFFEKLWKTTRSDFFETLWEKSTAENSPTMIISGVKNTNNSSIFFDFLKVFEHVS